MPNSEWGVGAVCEHDRNGARLADGNASIPVSDPISVGVYVTETVQKTPPRLLGQLLLSTKFVGPL